VLTFGVIAEGLSDQAVIENILLGYFQAGEEDPLINPIQPPNPNSPGGWTRVFQCLERGEPQKALQFNDFLVIQIDTDVQEEPGFDVPRRECGVELSVPERVARVIARLRRDIDPAFYQAEGHRIVFSVAVDSIECWLLPLLHDNNKAEKTTGCLEAANMELRRTRRNGLSAGETKFPRAYEHASRDYRKRKVLIEHRDRNPSLGLFITQLDDLQSRLTANDPGASPGDGKASPEGEKPPESTASE
jgi:hypothetical protein